MLTHVHVYTCTVYMYIVITFYAWYILQSRVLGGVYTCTCLYFYCTLSLYAADVDEQLMKIANVNSCPERERYVVILMDEMHINSDLVYDKHSGKLI